MDSLLILSLAATGILITLSVCARHWLGIPPIAQAQARSEKSELADTLPEADGLCKTLESALPDDVLLSSNATKFKHSINSYWAQQECEVIPACVVRPRDVQQLSKAITILKHHYDQLSGTSKGLFAIRSGGHSPVASAASIKGGVVIDLRLFREVTPSENGQSVVIGTGARWMDVSKVLDGRGLAVVGGRNSAVGVGGLTLGGKSDYDLLLVILSTLSSPDILLRPTPRNPHTSGGWLQTQGHALRFSRSDNFIGRKLQGELF